MPSPFPGMNPYLEQDEVWHCLHKRFVPHLSDLLVPQVRPDYIVILDESAYLHELPAQERQPVGCPDVSAVAMTGLKAPAWGRVPIPVDVEKLSSIQIRERQNRQIVTAIEVLSPTNKRPGPDREQYLARRRRYLSSGVHLVEIDLLRGWPRLPVEGLPPCDYCVMVSRYEERPQVALWPIALREPLPEVPIPLRAGEPEVLIRLQDALHHVYDVAGFEDYIYAQGNPTPPLRPEDAQWASQFVPPGASPAAP